MTATRRITTGIDRTDDMVDTWRVYAECDDEVTSLLISNMKVVGLDLDHEPARAELREMALTEHLGRCTACQRRATA